MELVNIKLIKKQWKIIFIKNYMQMVFLILVEGFLLFESLLDMFNRDKSVYKPCFFFTVIIIFPQMLLKINLRIRVGKYLKIIEKGNVYTACLQLIENANLMGGRYYFGDAYRYIFHFIIKENEIETYKKYAVVCLKINTDVLSLKKKGNQFIIPKDTKISVVEYKNKCVVLQNDCGFYDLAHDNSSIWLYKNYV